MLEDNRDFEQGGEKPVEPDEDQPICSAQPKPRWCRPLQDTKLLAEKCRFGFASRARSEQSDEQSAGQLQEVDHPEARIAHRGICASSDAIFDSHRQRQKRGRLAPFLGQCSGPGGVSFVSWPTASVMRRHTAAPWISELR
jgi:hypothetical protein